MLFSLNSMDLRGKKHKKNNRYVVYLINKNVFPNWMYITIVSL